MTPWQTLAASRGMNNRLDQDAKLVMTQAWLTAKMSRAKRIPPLSDVIGDTERKPQSGAEIARALKLKFGVADG